MSKRIEFERRVTIVVSGIVDEGTSPEKLIMQETDFLAEPKSANGCLSIDLVDEVEEI